MERDTDRSGPFTYWKRPWHKWLILATGILMLVCLWRNVQEYRNLAGADIFSPAQWARYTAQSGFQCAGNGLAAAVFLGSFLIGTLARSPRAAMLAEGALLLILALGWGAAGYFFRLAAADVDGVFWALILMLALVGGIHSLWKSRKETP